MDNTTYCGQLCARTQHLVRTRPANVTYVELAERAKVKVRWIEEFVGGRCKKPSAEMVERLYVVLTGKPLFED